MPTKADKASDPECQVDNRELTEILIKKFGYREGLFELSVQFQIASVSAGPSESKVYPSTIVGVSGVGLTRVETLRNHTVDAREVNPARRASKATGAKAKPKTPAKKK